MLAPQSIDPNDAVMVFGSSDVISEDPLNYQKEISEINNTTYISVDINLLDMTANTEHTKYGVDMTYLISTMTWKINISDIVTDNSGLPMLVTGHKYVGAVFQSDGNIPNNYMRTFSILEFTVDDRGLEKTLMTQGYELDFTATAKFVWRDSQGNISYTAEAYKGGTGTTPATNAAEVTHRGPIEKYIP